MKDKGFRRLILEYFIERKIEEIVLIALGLILLIFVPYLVGSFIGDNKSIYCDGSDFCDRQYDYEYCNENAECGKGIRWIEGVLYLVIGGMFLFVIIAIMYSWVLLNWENAEERAKKELASQKKEMAK